MITPHGLKMARIVHTHSKKFIVLENTTGMLQHLSGSIKKIWEILCLEIRIQIGGNPCIHGTSLAIDPTAFCCLILWFFRCEMGIVIGANEYPRLVMQLNTWLRG